MGLVAGMFPARTAIKEADMGLLDGVLGGVVGAGMVSVVSKMIEEQGGLQALIDRFQQNGLGGTVASWIGTGPNQPISPGEVHQGLGADLLQQISAKTGLSVEDLTQKLAQILPQAVDNMTPNGQVPQS
jgi:uncharacterized protein YidB (DUF937 family)